MAVGDPYKWFEMHNMQLRMASIMRSEYLTDGEILLENTGYPPTTYKVHRVFFEAASPTFHLFFTTASAQNHDSPRVILPQISKTTFEHIRDYIYTDSLPTFHKLDEMLELHSQAVTYGIRGMINKLSIIIEGRITKSTAVSILIHGNKCAQNDLIKAALETISNEATYILESEDFLTLDEKSLIRILKQDHLNVSNELQIFAAVKKWGETQCHKNCWDPNEDGNLRKILRKIIGHIRFPVMDQVEFVTNVAINNKILNLEDMVSILLYFTIPKERRSEIPPGRFNSTPRRTNPPVIFHEIKSNENISTTKYTRALAIAMVCFQHLVRRRLWKDCKDAFAFFEREHLVNKDNALLMYYYLFEVKDEDRLEKIRIIICQYADELFRTHQFLWLTEDMIIDLIKRDNMNVRSEIMVYHVIVRWGKQQCEENLENCTDENIRQVLDRIIKYIRFTEMSPIEFDDIVNSFPKILRDEEIAGVRAHWEKTKQAQEEAVRNREIQLHFNALPRTNYEEPKEERRNNDLS